MVLFAFSSSTNAPVFVGTYLNHKNTPFPTLSSMVMAYQTRHEDMHAIITEYVPNLPVPGTAAGKKAVYQNVSLTAPGDGAQPPPVPPRWNQADIADALRRMSIGGGAGGAGTSDCDDVGIAFDPVYDDPAIGLVVFICV